MTIVPIAVSFVTCNNYTIIRNMEGHLLSQQHHTYEGLGFMSRKLVALLTVFLLSLAACGRGDINPPTPIAPTSILSVPTQAPTSESAAAEPTASAAVDPTSVGDPAAGEALFNQFVSQANFACSNCHHANSGDRLVGPGLQGVAQRAAQDHPGMTAVEYLHTSIAEPNDFVVEGYPENLMPQVYAEALSEDQINNLVAYLLTL